MRVSRSGAAQWLAAVVAMAATLMAPQAQAADVLVERIESLYNDISLFKRDDGYYTLAFGARRLHYIESVINPKDELELPVVYTRSMTLATAYAAELGDMAMIGLGGGRTSWYLHKSIPDMKIAVAELDPAVVKIADKYFGVKTSPNFEVNAIDGRMFMTKTAAKFDIILVDAYRGPFVPFHLLTREFFTLAKTHLKPGGVVAQNVEPSTMLFDSAVATIASEFANLDFYKGEGNIVVIAYDGPRKDAAEIRRLATERQERYKFRYDITQLLDQKFSPPIDWSKKALTDDFAPVEYLKAIDRHNQKQ